MMLETNGPRPGGSRRVRSGSDRRPRFVYWPLLLVILPALAAVGCQSLPNIDPDVSQTEPAAIPELPDRADDTEGKTRHGQQQPDDDDPPGDANQPERGPFGFPRLSELLDDSPEDEEDDDDDEPKRPQKKTEPDINSPGPDTSNFPEQSLHAAPGPILLRDLAGILVGCEPGDRRRRTMPSFWCDTVSPTALSYASSATDPLSKPATSPATGWRLWPTISRRTCGRKTKSTTSRPSVWKFSS